MIKKIINLFKKKKTKSKEIKKEKAEVINFINRSKEKNKIQTEQTEIKKMDNLKDGGIFCWILVIVSQSISLNRTG